MSTAVRSAQARKTITVQIPRFSPGVAAQQTVVVDWFPPLTPGQVDENVAAAFRDEPARHRNPNFIVVTVEWT